MKKVPKTRVINEEEIIRILWGIISKKHPPVDPFDDDVSWAPVRAKRLLILKSDMLVVEGDVPPGMTLRQAASKAVVSAVSDFAAKGVRPLYCILSMGIPEGYATKKKITETALGFKDAFSRYGLTFLSGDTNATSSNFVIDCTLAGYADSIVRRRTASEGDIIGVSGDFGLQSAGLLILLGKAGSSDREFRRRAIESVISPRAQLARGLEARRMLTSCIDSSDGLALSLYHLAESSKVNLRLEELPIARGVEAFAKENSLDPEGLILFGGEEYELVCTFNQENVGRLRKLGLRGIGRVESKARGVRPVLRLGSKIVERSGWIHFKSKD